MKKIYKRLAAFCVLFCLIFIPFLFWLGGWNFERNEKGLACVFITGVAIVFSCGITFAIGNEDR